MTARAELQGCCDNDVKQSNYWTTVCRSDRRLRSAGVMSDLLGVRVK